MKDPADNPTNEMDQEPVVPARLVAALAELREPAVAVPDRIDEAILAQARSHIKGIAKTTVVQFPRIPNWLAAAAAVLAGLGLTFLLSRSGSDVPAFAREDVDRNGRIDMLDAFALARKLQAGPMPDRMFDLNGDGAIDQRDIDTIAAQAVKIHKG